MLYLTEYRTRMDSRRRTTLYAGDEREAELFARRRGLGERVSHVVHEADFNYASYRPVLTSEWLKAQNWAEAHHAACWLAMLAVSARVLHPMEVLADDGFMHHMAHIHLEYGSEVTTIYKDQGVIPDFLLQDLIQTVKKIEADVPGMLPTEDDDEQKVRERRRLLQEGIDMISFKPVVLPDSGFDLTPNMTVTGRIKAYKEDKEVLLRLLQRFASM